MPLKGLENKPLKKTALKRKTSLKGSIKPSTVSKPKKRSRVPLEKKPIPYLIREADKQFSRYIRLRDSERKDEKWIGVCITCNKKIVVLDSGKWAVGLQNGHFIGRGNRFLRYDERNCNGQCAHCNAWRDKSDMLEAYEKGLDAKYGAGTAHQLKQEAKLNYTYKVKREELLNIISDSKTQVEYILNHY